ncbi:MAG: glycosyl hydrolase family 8 [bacterium]|nr:glycosyl hydrolase family 8 [bacterium]
MKKTRLIKSFFFFSIIFMCSAASAGQLDYWEKYKSEFLSDDGRIIDYSHEKISHSEGQGYGMVLALANGDRPTFEKIWHWTDNNLLKRKDHLFAWQWGERPNGDWDVLDYNNATDGDILIAYALLKAGKDWNNSAYTKQGMETVGAIREKLATSWQDYSLLLPGYDGFQKSDRLSINPSYFILPAFRLFAKMENKKFWEKIYSDSISIIAEGQFGKWGLPSDWIELSGSGMEPDTGKSPYFGYNAVRVLLYLSYESKPEYPRGLKKIFSSYNTNGYIPLRIDLERESLSLLKAPAGFYAVYSLAAKRSGQRSLSNKLLKEAENLLSKEKKSYYSFVLFLLATSEAVLN